MINIKLLVVSPRRAIHFPFLILKKSRAFPLPIFIAAGYPLPPCRKSKNKTI
jgi:hypothetical protein